VEHVDAIVAEVLRRLDRPRFSAPTYVVDLAERTKVHDKLCTDTLCVQCCPLVC
jgi:hypothetical protein